MDRHFLCQYCHKIYISSSNFTRHLKTVHGLCSTRIAPKEYDYDRYIFKCLEGCKTSYATTSRLIDHLILKHNKDIPTRRAEFLNFEDFLKWKSELEMENTVQYIQHNGKKVKESVEILHFKCNRSCKKGDKVKGDELPVGYKKRRPKMYGSSKINCSCTSKIITQVDRLTSKCKVNYIDFHYGHELDVRYVKIPKLERLEIAKKLMQGVSVSRVLEDIRGIEEMPRATLITRKDIHNIKKAFKINGVDTRKHSDDLTSVSMWVEETLQQVDNPILLYKIPLEEHQTYPQDQDLVFDFNYDDFCLILMSNAQAILLREFGSNLVCVDSCHACNKYEFELTTLVVVDEFGQGLPVACMWSNRMDTEIMEIFLLVVRGYAGEIRCSLFMSDMGCCYYDAWDSVMSEVDERIHTPWNVDSIWQVNLTRLVKIREKRKEIFSLLKELQTMEDKNLFEDSLEDFIESLSEDPDTIDFHEYFCNVFGDSPQNWAICFRDDSPSKHDSKVVNSSLEALHRVIRFEYMEGQRMRRLDKGLACVSKLIDDKLVERVNKITGEDTSETLTVSSTHSKAFKSNFTITQVSDMEWEIFTKSGKIYYVEKNTCIKCCDFACEDCNICYHSFKCGCPDYLNKRLICKHIHRLVIEYYGCTEYTLDFPRTEEAKPLIELLESDSYQVSHDQNKEESTESLTAKQSQSENKIKRLNSVDKIQKAIISEVSTMTELIHKITSTRVLKMALQTATSTTALLKLKVLKKCMKQPVAKTNLQKGIRESLLYQVSSIPLIALNVSDKKLLRMSLSSAQSLTKLLKLNIVSMKLKTNVKNINSTIDAS